MYDDVQKVAATTPGIDRYWDVPAQLGERFLRFRLASLGRKSKVRRALENTDQEEQMRRETSAAAMGVLAQGSTIPRVTDAVEERLIHLADFVARARSEVSRDRLAKTASLAEAAEIPTETAKTWLDDLRMLGIADRGAVGLGGSPSGLGVAHRPPRSHPRQAGCEGSGQGASPS